MIQNAWLPGVGAKRSGTVRGPSRFGEGKVHKAGSCLFVDALGACDFIGVPCYRRLVDSGADLIQTDRLPDLVPFLARVNN